MAADNWTKCPKCVAEMAAKREAAIVMVKAEYGKLTPDEFVEKMRVAESLPIGPVDETVREDYEIGLDSDGSFMVVYRCYCRACGFSWEFNHDISSADVMRSAKKA